jgi:hypothetical protein
MSKKPGSPKGPSQRQLRVGELIRHELSALFMRGDVMDPVIEKTGVTVLEVATSPDLKIATPTCARFNQVAMRMRWSKRSSVMPVSSVVSWPRGLS